MIGAVHAAIGAGLGSLFGEKGTAFLAGVVSHLAADAVPHKDFSLKVELPLLAGALVGIGLWRGTDSTEFWGALGAIAPDIEHGLTVTGVIRPEARRFPTHANDGALHGPESDERLSQLLLVAASLLAIHLDLSSTRRSPR